ncbi:hypothetical protein DMP23_24420 [Amycolatopsis sp. A1MSW2902]
MNPNCPHGWPRPETEMTCLDDREVVFRGDQVSVRFGEAAASPGFSTGSTSAAGKASDAGSMPTAT